VLSPRSRPTLCGSLAGGPSPPSPCSRTRTGRRKSVRVRIDLPFSGNNESFIGTIKPGNDAPAVFNLIAERTGSLADTLSLSYHDDEGVPTISEPLTLEVAENHGSPVTIVVVAVLLAAAGIWFWRRRGA